MQRDPTEIVQDIYAGWSEGDFRAGVKLFDPLMLFVLPPGFPDSGAYLGPERIAEYMRGFLEPWTRLTITAEETIRAGDSVVVAVRQSGVGSGSGAATEFRYFQVWTFRGGRVVRLENFRERDEAMAAIGLRG